MISRIRKWLLVFPLFVIFSGCSLENNLPEPTTNPPVIKMPADDTTPRQRVSLGAALFSGKILLESAQIQEKGNSFTLPVFLEGVETSSALDTVSLKLALPEGVFLSSVPTPAGFSAEIEGMSSKNPVVYFHGNGTDVTIISSAQKPILSLVFEGRRSGEIAVRGGFFFRDATLKQTNRAVLNLEQ